ncbi:unnamed protein product [Symbiodinium natans]|uniref:Uncharacterized protein n=1 Tax=Symbiodinium natans TaxID=878477 RepID=A0A812NV47_9DINO|nr:unnamed protein product [Symbiodinium natans]
MSLALPGDESLALPFRRSGSESLQLPGRRRSGDGSQSVSVAGRRGRRLSASREPWEEMSMALFRRLDPTSTGMVHQDQLQSIWPTLTQHVEGVPRELKAQRRQRSVQVSTAEWQSLMAALCAVVGTRRFKSSMRRADVVISKSFPSQKPSSAGSVQKSCAPTVRVETPPEDTACRGVRSATEVGGPPAPPSPSAKPQAGGPPSLPPSPAKSQAQASVASEMAKEVAAPTSPLEHEAGATPTPLSPTANSQAGGSPSLPPSPSANSRAGRVSPSARSQAGGSPSLPASPSANSRAGGMVSPSARSQAGGSPSVPPSPSANSRAGMVSPSARSQAGGSPSLPASPSANSRAGGMVSPSARSQAGGSPSVPPSPSANSRAGSKHALRSPSAKSQAGTPTPLSPSAKSQASGRSVPPSPSAKSQVGGSPSLPPSPSARSHAQASAVSEMANEAAFEAVPATEAGGPPSLPPSPARSQAQASAASEMAKEEAGSSDFPAAIEAPLPLSLAEEEEAEEAAEGTNEAIALLPSPKSEAATVTQIAELPSADEAEADAFARRFRQLRAEQEAEQQRSAATSSLSKLLNDDSQEQLEDDKGHEVMGVNARILQEVRASPAGPDDLEHVEFNLGEPAQQRKRQVWDHRGNSVLSWNEDLDEVTATRSSAAREYRQDAQASESQALGSRDLTRSMGSGQSSQGSVRLPKIDSKLSRANSAPSGIRLEDSFEDSFPLKDSIQSALESSSVQALRERLRSEMTLHQQTRAHAQDLERRLQLATSRKRDLRAASDDKPRFGVASGGPYAAKAAKTEKEKRSIVLPPLRSPKPSAPARRAGDPVGPVVQDMLREEHMSTLSRQEQSRTRLQAFGKLGHAGLSTWDVRLEEKVSRFQDMRAFSESMWNSFYDWNAQYQTPG